MSRSECSRQILPGAKIHPRQVKNRRNPYTISARCVDTITGMKGNHIRTFRQAGLFTFGLFAAGLLSIRTTSAADHYRQDRPKGIMCVIADDPGNPIDPVPFTRDYVKGIAFQIQWKEIEPTRGHPDWTKLDELFEKARASHKWIQLLVFAGFWTPDWAQVGAQTDEFRVQYGPGHRSKLPLPMPWDPVYRRNWYDFVHLLAARYGFRPELRVIAASGPTSVSVEATLPNSTREVNKWIVDGYTPEKYLDAWHEAFEEFSHDFPLQYISLSHGDGLPINNHRALDDSEIIATSLAEEADGYCTLRERFTFQSSALTGKARYLTTPAFAQVMSYVGHAQTGFQDATNCEHGFRKMGGTDPKNAMQNTLANAASKNAFGRRVDYWQVQAEDVDSDNLQTILNAGAAIFDSFRW